MLWRELLIAPFITTYKIKSPGHPWEFLATDLHPHLLLARLSTAEMFFSSRHPVERDARAADHRTEMAKLQCLTQKGLTTLATAAVHAKPMWVRGVAPSKLLFVCTFALFNTVSLFLSLIDSGPDKNNRIIAF